MEEPPWPTARTVESPSSPRPRPWYSLVLARATMVLLGDLNWWLRGWVDRILPKMNLESVPVDLDVDEDPVTVG
jgi:hypothetical protein